MIKDLSKKKWRKEIGFNLSLNEVKLRIFDLEVKRDQLKNLTKELLVYWSECFPRSSVPIYLTQVSDRSLTVLRWRRSKTHSNKASQVMLDEDTVQFFYRDDQRELLFKFESLRIDLNYKLAMVLYEIQRLQSFSDDADNLVSLRNKIKV